MKRLLALLAVGLVLAACSGSNLTGIAAGFKERSQAPRRPLADPATATFRFEPFEGIPGNVSDELLQRIWVRAEREGLNVVKRPDGPAVFVVEGSLSAVSDDTNSLVFYSFDVTDITGRRLHRITGRKRSEDSDGDPWAGVTSQDLDVIARRLALLLDAWLHAA
ncbi:hypothetical protein [Acuticoccus mangrovi]|uniref:Lipoprotein n=1 Tax=Acuticoccus mangrovi TaxID=2796142 RepID=A0A934IEK2_9HYPH|nr:hypothetical protein [Acuticoccus mangrovi]MBJ3775159.1 hypothetical protein [Acuticoccus mangrovi]